MSVTESRREQSQETLWKAPALPYKIKP